MARGIVIRVTKEIKQKCNRFKIEEFRPEVVKISWQGANEEFVSIVQLGRESGAIDGGFSSEGEELMGTGIRRIVN